MPPHPEAAIPVQAGPFADDPDEVTGNRRPDHLSVTPDFRAYQTRQRPARQTPSSE
jgi:hypothetical protein